MESSNARQYKSAVADCRFGKQFERRRGKCVMTTIYFIRHAQADNTIRDGRIRPLTEKGMNDRALVTEFLQDKDIDAVLSSPFKRAIDTVAEFANKNDFEIEIVEDFRERKSDIDFASVNFDFETFMEQQWADFNYTYSDGECLAEVQNRNIAALNDVLKKYSGKNIVIGTHGTALSTIINYYDRTYGFADFMAMVNMLPWVVKADFNDDGCISMEKIDLFAPVTTLDFNNCVIRAADLGALKAYKFVVVFSRHQDKWLYCRAKERDCYETAGGHVESGETPLEAAKRELYEETGAIKFDITPAFDYSAHFPNFYNTGQVYFAQIHELGDIPDFEMAEVKLLDTIPDKMRFPKILPILYERMQMWLNLQSAKDEIWDVYDSERNLTGRTIR
jgi:2,3-bisphosphoglycerate-dependent phosphoglycerate mutase